MTSSKPGKTLLINHFIINSEWHLVDLPGYGFAQAGKANRERLRKMIESYILMRNQLTNLFLLIDSRHVFKLILRRLKPVCNFGDDSLLNVNRSRCFPDGGTVITEYYSRQYY